MLSNSCHVNHTKDFLLTINPMKPGLFSRSPGLRGWGGGGCSKARMENVKVNINRLK